MDLAAGSVAVVLGTRPEIVKLAGIVRLLGDRARLVHTGQHYDDDLSGVFLRDLGLPDPVAHLGVGGVSRAGQIAETVEQLAASIEADRPAMIVVQGDTNTTLGAALAANATEVPLVHVEAGLRSFDRRMPEEHNRVIADHLSDLLLAPTTTASANLKAEAVAADRIVVTGNTVVEAVTEMLPDESERAAIAAAYGVGPDRFVLATLHRPENVDDAATLSTVLEELAALPFPVILPLHPRTATQAERFGITSLLDRLRVVDPVGYRDFLALGAASAMVVSDSGGVQEEVSVYKRPVIVVRRSTERPEVIGTFAERVEPGPGIGELATRWLDDLEAVHARLAETPTPYGDGTASKQSVRAILALAGTG